MRRAAVARAPVLLGLLTAGALLAGVVHPAAARADGSSSDGPLTLALAGPASLRHGTQGVLEVALGPAGSPATGRLLVVSMPAAGGEPSVLLDVAAGPTADPLQVPLVADVPRHVVATFEPDDAAAWPAPEPATFDLGVTPAQTAELSVVGAPASGAAVRPGTGVWRSFGGTASIRLLDGLGAPLAGERVTLQQRSADTRGVYATVGTAVTGPTGTATLRVDPWVDTTYRVVHQDRRSRFARVVSPELLVRPLTPGRPVVAPRGAPQPAAVAVPLARATGSGASPTVGPIPDTVWASMVGYTWSPSAHCPLGRAQLAYVLVNYWGFDGNRYRGELVVARSRAAAIARAFATIYDARFPIRSMVRPDRFGRSPHGWPGADDYASMARDNTYAFNCRYVVGAESRRQMSPHAYGTAVDINTWENPDVAANGTHPNAWFAHHRSAAMGGVIVANSVVVRAMRAAGLGWGAAIHDYQHFDPSLR